MLEDDEMKMCLMRALELVQLAENEEWLIAHGDLVAEALQP